MLNAFIMPWELESEIGFSQESGDLAVQHHMVLLLYFTSYYVLRLYSTTYLLLMTCVACHLMNYYSSKYR
jgi:hypothetical protein